MNDNIFQQAERQPEAQPATQLANQTPRYLRPELVELGRTDKLIQGTSYGGYPDGYTGYRKSYW